MDLLNLLTNLSTLTTLLLNINQFDNSDKLLNKLFSQTKTSGIFQTKMSGQQIAHLCLNLIFSPHCNQILFMFLRDLLQIFRFSAESLFLLQTTFSLITSTSHNNRFLSFLSSSQLPALSLFPLSLVALSRDALLLLSLAEALAPLLRSEEKTNEHKRLLRV